MKEGEFTYVAQIIHKDQNHPYCSGTIIHELFILTAAHCLNDGTKWYPKEDLQVVVGSIYVDGTSGQTIQVKNYYYPDDDGHRYDMRSEANDIAIIEVK